MGGVCVWVGDARATNPACWDLPGREGGEGYDGDCDGMMEM